MTGEMATVKQAMNKLSGFVYGEVTEYAYSSNNLFNTDQALGATPTLYITLSSVDGRPVKNFWLESVRWYLEIEGGAGITYQLYLLEAASADDIQNRSDIVYDTYTLGAQAMAYEACLSGRGVQGAVTSVEFQLPKLVRLETPNRLLYQIDWSADPVASSVRGYIKVRGRPLLGEKVS